MHLVIYNKLCYNFTIKEVLQWQNAFDADVNLMFLLPDAASAEAMAQAHMMTTIQMVMYVRLVQL